MADGVWTEVEVTVTNNGWHPPLFEQMVTDVDPGLIPFRTSIFPLMLALKYEFALEEI